MDDGFVPEPAVRLSLMHRALKLALNMAGGLLSLAGVAFVGIRLSGYMAEIDLARFHWKAWLLAGFFALVYGAANTLLARAWWNLMEFLKAPAGWGWAWRIYGVSQLAKYVPGNIFHLASRQALSMAAGFEGWMLAKSTVWELGLLVLAGAMFFGLILDLLFPSLPFFVPLLVFVGVFFLVDAGLRCWWGPAIASAFAWQWVFLIVSGLVFVGILALIAPQSVDPALLPTFCGSYVVAWLAGLVTPGAPAGVGVRELVLLYMLEGHVVETNLLLAVVLGRLVTVAGDLLFFCMASMARAGRG